MLRRVVLAMLLTLLTAGSVPAQQAEQRKMRLADDRGLVYIVDRADTGATFPRTER
jgi:hypothetical protein